MNIVILNGLDSNAANKCLDSMIHTSDLQNHNIHIVKERESREHTLNFALESIGTKDDMLFVGDDIEFTAKWYSALQNNKEKAHILGMSMLYPNTEIIQDRGYRLIDVDGEITLAAIDRGKQLADLAPDEFSLCDTVCGCFLFIKKEVFSNVPRFREEGKNRWGEFIFTLEAAQAGMSIGVISHYLFHSGHSTKTNPNKVLSSTSYTMEKPIWSNIVAKYVDKHKIKLRLHSQIDAKLKSHFANKDTKILIYGIGTVTHKLYYHLDLLENRVELCTGLTEEVGMTAYNSTVMDINLLNLTDYDWIVITPQHSGEKIFAKYFEAKLPPTYKGIVSIIKTRTINDHIEYYPLDLY